MNSQIILGFLNALMLLIPQITNSKGINSVIVWIQQMTPIIIQEYQDLKPILQNVISLLKQNSAVTPAQMAAIDASDADVDKAFDDAYASYLVNHPDPAPVSAAAPPAAAPIQSYLGGQTVAAVDGSGSAPLAPAG